MIEAPAQAMVSSSTKALHFPQLGMVLLNGWSFYVQSRKSVRHLFHLYWDSLSDCEHYLFCPLQIGLNAG